MLDQGDAKQVMDIVSECSRSALPYFRVGTPVVENKLDQGFDPVTVADRSVERALREALEKRFGALPVIGEEEGITGDPTDGYAWIIDPIDGTRAFISGQPQWGTLLGLLHDGMPVGGWMHVPVLNESVWAFETAFSLTSPLPTRGRSSDCTEIAHATMTSTHPSMFVGPVADRFWNLEQSVRLSRFGGDCHNYGLLAAGDIDLVVEDQMQTYDILPLVPIIEAAGAVVTDGRGEPPLDGGMIIAAATPQLHAAALDAMTDN